MLCSVKGVLQRFMSSMLMSHTNAHDVRGRPTLNDVERFRNGSLIHEFYNYKASQNMSKVHTSSHKITNTPYVSANYENTTTTVTGDLTTNYDVEKNTSFAEKIKNVGEHFESGANDCKLDKDTEGSNLNSRVKYLSLVLSLNILFLFLVFIGFNTCKERFGIAYIVTIAVVQPMVNVGLLLAWSCMCLVEDMINTLDDCDLLEKVINMINAHEHNDITIKVQQFRSRYAKYVYYNCTRVLCECHGYKRDREPSRIPVKMFKSLSQKSRKLRVLCTELFKQKRTEVIESPASY